MKNGTYVAVTFSDETTKKLFAFCNDNEIPNHLNEEDFHCTVVYSKTVLENVQNGPIPNWIAKPLAFHIFESDGKNCLVLTINSGNLLQFHKRLVFHHGATHNFDSYIQHITLSYDIGDFDYSSLPLFDGEIVIVSQYAEELK